MISAKTINIAQPLLDNLRSVATLQKSQDIIPYINKHLTSVLHTKADWNLAIYDTAWVLCSQVLPDDKQAQIMRGLLEKQNSVTGLWGDGRYMPHSIVVDTLAMLMALTRLKQPIALLSTLIDNLNRVLRDCRQYIHHDTVAFELIAPVLIKWLDTHGCPIALDSDVEDYIKTLWQSISTKLKLIQSKSSVFDAGTTLSFTAEILTLMPEFADDLQQFAKLITTAEGGIGLAPAATAGVIALFHDNGQRAADELYTYIDATFEDYHQQYFPNLYPLRNTIILWNTLPFLLSNNTAQLLKHTSIYEVLEQGIEQVQPTEAGIVAWDKANVALPDLDDTSVFLALTYALNRQNAHISYKNLQHFQRKDKRFFCYEFELHPSLGSMLHALMALDFVPVGQRTSLHQRLQQDLLTQLNPSRQSMMALGHDKWHATWTYGIQRWLSIPAILMTYPERMADLVQEILSKQDEGWGQLKPTLEETAYIVSGLSAYLYHNKNHVSSKLCSQMTQAIDIALRFMRQDLKNKQHFESIWISKVVYTPHHQITAAVLSSFYDAMRIRELFEH